jgi:hypothetical protein
MGRGFDYRQLHDERFTMERELRLMAKATAIALDEINKQTEEEIRKTLDHADTMINDREEYFWFLGVAEGLQKSIDYNNDFAEKLLEACDG